MGCTFLGGLGAGVCPGELGSVSGCLLPTPLFTCHSFKDTCHVPSAAFSRSQGRAQASLDITPSLLLENDLVVGHRHCFVLCKPREYDSVVIDGSGGHFANCSWPSHLGHLLFWEEGNWFALAGVAWLCSTQVPMAENTTRGPSASSEVHYSWLGLPFAFVSLSVPLY